MLFEYVARLYRCKKGKELSTHTCSLKNKWKTTSQTRTSVANAILTSYRFSYSTVTKTPVRLPKPAAHGVRLRKGHAQR